MGTLQSITNVNCCSSKREDELSDDERAEGEEAKETPSVCVAHPWNYGPGAATSHAPVAVPRSISNATTIPTHLQK